MLKRVFYVIPNPQQADEVVSGIEHMGIERDHIHSLALEDIELSTSSNAIDAEEEGTEAVWKIEGMLWKMNLVIFGLASIAGILTAAAGSTTWTELALAIMVVSCLTAAIFVFYVPEIHLNEFSEALEDGETVVMVDVPEQRVPDIQTWIDSYHPEAIRSGGA